MTEARCRKELRSTMKKIVEFDGSQRWYDSSPKIKRFRKVLIDQNLIVKKNKLKRSDYSKTNSYTYITTT